jgi:acetyl esterase/lipase
MAMVERERPERMPVVYSLPNMDAVAISKDVPYRQLDGVMALADIYRPTNAHAPLPAVIFVHGDGPPEMGPAKEWGQYRGWGRLAAASGWSA